MFDPVDDSNNYKWGVFYYNVEDNRIIVPKRDRFAGFTINFGHRLIHIIIPAILIVIFLLLKK